ncbi:MAG: OmpA family protein [Candidatus Cyclobacteriaceae bacterium M3_2C_046]
MRKFVSYSVFLGILCVFFSPAWAQNEKDIEKAVYRADKLFRIRNYTEALAEYQAAIKLGDQSPFTRYRIGECYINLPNTDDQLKAVPHFEFALQHKNENIPDDIYFKLGKVYHKDLEVQKAIDAYNEYLKILDKRHPLYKDVQHELSICQNALTLLNEYKSNIIIRNLGEKINTAYTEYNPVVSADASVMAFTRLSPNDNKSLAGDIMEEIFITYKKSRMQDWNQPELINLETKFNLGTAGISPDGENMIIFIGGINNTGNLYTIKKTTSGWSTPVTLGHNINSNYLESTASITPDGKTIYFASNRPGGYGGMDIYVIHKDNQDKWGYPKNLGPEVNSKDNEDAPFIHPDQRTLFFTSDGHNTMGGKDIFKTEQENSGWSDPVNMGFPINTPANDNYFTLTADGSKGYFSSDRKGGFGGQDIYSFDMPEEDANIPLTMVKGRILAGEDLQPVPTQIKVIDNNTSKKVDFVYNPNKETGNYLIIFPPGKNYDMVIESEGYMPYTLNVNIPNQNYFYELYQEIHLKPIKHFDVVVGQEVSVKNIFFDTGQEIKVDVRKANEAMLIQNDSLDLFDLMDAIISSTDSVALDYLLDLAYNTNPLDNVNFDSYEDSEMESAKRVYYYDESDTTTLEMREIDGELIYSLPTLHVTEENEKRKQKEEKAITYNEDVLDPVYKIYFDADKSDLKSSYFSVLDKIMTNLNQYEDLGIEISGFASSDGDADYNRRLSNQRAIEVLDYFNRRGVVRRRIMAKGFGASQNKDNSKEESRRVEIRMVDLNKYNL